MSRTVVHTKLIFIVPHEDLVYLPGHSTPMVSNWKHRYYDFFSRYRVEKPYRKVCNRRERASLRDSLRRMRYDKDLFDDYVPPRYRNVLHYLI